MFSPATQFAPCRTASGVPEAAVLSWLAGGAVPVTAGVVTVPAAAALAVPDAAVLGEGTTICGGPLALADGAAAPGGEVATAGATAAAGGGPARVGEGG